MQRHARFTRRDVPESDLDSGERVHDEHFRVAPVLDGCGLDPS